MRSPFRKLSQVPELFILFFSLLSGLSCYLLLSFTLTANDHGLLPADEFKKSSGRAAQQILFYFFGEANTMQAGSKPMLAAGLFHFSGSSLANFFHSKKDLPMTVVLFPDVIYPIFGV